VDQHIQDMLQTLQEARSAVDAEMSKHLGLRPFDTGILRRLGESTAEFGWQAEFLAEVMQDHDAEDTLIEEAHELSAFFVVTEYQVESLLSGGQP
jgi:hypothetical protein